MDSHTTCMPEKPERAQERPAGATNERGPDDAAWPPRRRATAVLIGKAGHGKSSVGNLLLDRRAFESRRSLVGVTNRCHLDSVLEPCPGWEKLIVIDTPGLCRDSEEAEDDALREIELSVKIADGIEDSTGQAGVDALMIVLSLAACLTRGELAALDAVRKRLGHRCFEHRGLVVWTHADIVEEEGFLVEDLLQADSPGLQELLKEVEGRFVVVGLGSKREGSSSQLGHGGLMQRTKILEVVAAVVDKNKGVPYTHSDQPKKMRMKQARRMRQAAQRQANAAQQLSSSGSWFDRLLEFVAPAPSAAPIPEG